MKKAMILMMLLVATMSATTFAQSRRPRRFQRQTTFGELYGSSKRAKLLQRELRLTKSQLKRMQEIHYQSLRLADMLYDVKMMKELGLSKGQIVKLHNVKADMMSKFRKLVLSQPKTLEDLRDREAKMTSFRNDEDEAMLEILTSSQRRKIEKLKGTLIEKPKKKPVKRAKKRPDV